MVPFSIPEWTPGGQDRTPGLKFELLWECERSVSALQSTIPLVVPRLRRCDRVSRPILVPSVCQGLDQLKQVQKRSPACKLFHRSATGDGGQAHLPIGCASEEQPVQEWIWPLTTTGRGPPVGFGHGQPPRRADAAPFASYRATFRGLATCVAPP